MGQDSVRKAHVFSKQEPSVRRGGGGGGGGEGGGGGGGNMRHSAIGRLKRRRWSLIFGKKQEKGKTSVKR